MDLKHVEPDTLIDGVRCRQDGLTVDNDGFNSHIKDAPLVKHFLSPRGVRTYSMHPNGPTKKCLTKVNRVNVD
ncbi:hypothetical protein VEE68_44040 [Escherichia coli]|nr:hypothetical protein VEE68_44040 [Escherichia coli]